MATTHLRLLVDLGPDFIAHLNGELEDELSVASRKWDFHPGDDERVEILRHAYGQVSLRIQSVSNNTWDRSSLITFTMPGPELEIAIPSEEADKASFKIVRARDGWIIDQHESEDSVMLSDFPDRLRNEIFAWGRTAVFYSIGSYKN